LGDGTCWGLGFGREYRRRVPRSPLFRGESRWSRLADRRSPVAGSACGLLLRRESVV